MSRVLRWCGAAAIAALALSGCLRTTVDTTVASDNTFSQHSIIAFTDDAATLVGGETGMDVTSLREDLAASPDLVDLQERFPGQVELEDYSDEDLHGIEMTVTDLPLAEFNTATAQASTGLTGGAQLTREGETFVLEMSVPQDSPQAPDLEELGVTQSQLDLVMANIDVSVSYTFPGPIQSASAGTTSGHTVTLGLADLMSGRDIHVVASAGDSINWEPILTWGGVALAFILVIGGATALIVQDRRTSLRNTLPAHQATDHPTGPGLLGETTDQGDPRIGEDNEDERPSP